MTKKILILILVLGLILVSGFVSWSMEKKQKPELIKQGLLQKFQTLKTQYKQAKTKGYDVSQVERLGREAKRAFKRGDYKKANELLDRASRILADMTKESTIPSVSPKPTKLSQAKVASLYESVTDGVPPERSIGDIADILDDTGTDFVFRGFWKRFQPNETYTELAQTIRAIKDKSPDMIFCGAVPAQRIWIKDRNLITGEVIEYPETWRMALDPAKWNITAVSKEELQCEIARQRGIVGDCREFNPREVYAYFPDITNEEFQELFLSWIKKQIDCGADAIWIDMLFKQAEILKSYVGLEHPAVKESYMAASKMVDEIHQYGDSKGKYIYVGTWSGFQDYPYDLPDIDFVTLWRPKPYEIKAMEIDETRWDITISQIRNKLGDIPIFVFIDWGTNDESPTGVFSQMLEPEEQREFLKTVDNFSSSRGVIFVYPIHGGFMGPNAKTLSFGKYKTYDSLAPEFQTYKTIKELAQKKAGR